MFMTRFHSFKRFEYMGQFRKVFEYLTQEIFMNVLRMLYESSWNFINTTMRHDYRRYIDQILPMKIYIDINYKLQYIYRKHTSNEELIHDSNSRLEYAINAEKWSH